MLRSWRELRDARRKGRRDGRAGVPSMDQDALPFDLREILARTDERVHRLVQRWTRDDHVLAVELGELEQRAIAANARLADAEMQRDVAAATDELRSADEEERLAALQRRLEELPLGEIPTFETEEPEPPIPLVPAIAGGSPPRAVPPRIQPEAIGDAGAWTAHPVPGAEETGWKGLGPVAYWLLIATIVIGEIPLNAFAFRLFHESDLLTYAMTVTVAVGLVAFAHVLGLLLSRSERSRIERAIVGACVVVPLTAITVISFVRYGYLLGVAADARVGPLLGTLAFGCMNLLVFGAATGLSYLRHDPRTLVNRRAALHAAEHERTRTERRLADQERARLRRVRRAEDETIAREEELRRKQRAEERARRRDELELEAERRRVDLQGRRDEAQIRREQILEAMRPIREAARERAEEVARSNRVVDDVRVALGEVEQRIGAVAARRRALWDATNAAIREAKAGRDRLAYAYCSANVRARRGHGTPPCFDELPPLQVPPAFEGVVSEVA